MIIEGYDKAVASADRTSNPPPDGTYVCLLKTPYEGRNDDNSPYTGVAFVVAEGEYEGRVHFERYPTASEFGGGKFELLRRAVGVPVEKLSGGRASIDLSKFAGRKVNATIRSKPGKVGTKGEGVMYPNIVGVSAFNPDAVKAAPPAKEPWEN